MPPDEDSQLDSYGGCVSPLLALVLVAVVIWLCGFACGKIL